MTKREQLIEYITQDILAYLMEEQDIDWPEAMRIFYSSKTYEKLYDVKTGLYLESSAYVFSILKDELMYEKIIRNEI